MSDTRIMVISYIEAKDGSEDELVALMGPHLAASHKEPGVIGFAMHRDPGNPGRLAFVEAYAEADDLERHRETPHYRRLMGLLPELLTGRPDTMVFEPLPVGDKIKGEVWGPR